MELDVAGELFSFVIVKGALASLSIVQPLAFRRQLA